MKIKKIKPLHAGLIALAVILIGFLVWGGIYCAVNDETPSDMLARLRLMKPRPEVSKIEVQLPKNGVLPSVPDAQM